jgi:hypothetical protein
MRKSSCVTSGRTLVVFAAALATSLSLSAFAQDAHPFNDTFKGDKLDPKWNVTVLGNAQDQDSSVKVENGQVRIQVGGTDIWDNNDNGMFIWQPANGDFQVTLELRGLKRTDASAKLGIMVRSSLDIAGPHIFTQVMPKGGTMQVRTEYGAAAGPGSGCPGDECNPFGDPDEGDLGNQPTILQRLTRTGSKFKSDRSYDGGKTWVGLHTGSRAAQDEAEVVLPDDVLVGIGMTAHNGSEVGEGVFGPVTFAQTAARPTDNGLVAATATDANGAPVAGVGLVLKKGSDVAGTSVGEAVISNTASFFLNPGTYTIEAPESDTYAAGAPVPFEIQTGKTVVLKIPVGKAK